jgi:hypothetical protein
MKRRKKWLLAFFAGLVVLGTYHVLTVFPPKLSLTFLGFVTDGTNRIERLCFKNESKNTIWWWNANYTIVPENGQAQEMLGGRFVSLVPSSNVVVTVPIPGNCPRWRVELAFEYYRFPPFARLFAERYVYTGKFTTKPDAPLKNALFRVIDWCLNRLPEPKPLYGMVSTDYITNTSDTNRLVFR